MNLKDFSGVDYVDCANHKRCLCGAYFYIDVTYAKAQRVELVAQRFDQHLKQERVDAIQQRLWKIEERLYDQKREPTDIEKQEIRNLEKEKEKIEKGLKIEK